jgi:hypothetical protein
MIPCQNFFSVSGFFSNSASEGLSMNQHSIKHASGFVSRIIQSLHRLFERSPLEFLIFNQVSSDWHFATQSTSDCETVFPV